MKQQRMLIIDGNLFARKMFYKFKKLSSLVTPEAVTLLPFLERLIPQQINKGKKYNKILDDDSGEVLKLSKSGRINVKLEKMMKESDLGPFLIETGVAYGMIRSLISTQKKHNIRKIIICYDPIKRYREQSHRLNIKGTYKEDRIPDPKDIKKIEENKRFFRQLYLAQNIIRLFGIEQTWVKTFEADDLLHYYSKVLYKKEECLILTSDHDIYQCLDNTNSILKKGDGDPKSIYTKKDFIRQFGIPPQRYRDVMSLYGCPGDSVGGLPGIGEATALELIQTFGNLKGVLKKFKKGTLKPKVMEILRKDRKNKFEIVKETRKLISLYGKSKALQKEMITDRLNNPIFKHVLYSLKALKFNSLIGKEELIVIKKIIKRQSK